MELDQQQHVPQQYIQQLHHNQIHIVEMESYKVMNNVTQEVDISEMDVMKIVN
jgi:hypothetical protein